MRFSKRMGPILILPAMLLILVFLIWPLIYTLYCSFFKLDYLQNGGFVAFNNYQKILKDAQVFNSFRVTFIVTAASTLISMLLGLVLALWIERRHGMTAFAIELTGLLPWVISMMVGTMLWRWILNGDTSLFNFFVKAMGGEPVLLFNNKDSAGTKRCNKPHKSAPEQRACHGKLL